MPDLQGIVRNLELLGVSFNSRHAAYVNWAEGDVVKILPIERALLRAYPAATALRNVESVMVDSSGKSDRNVYEGVLGGGQRVTFYGWQVIDKDKKFGKTAGTGLLPGTELPPGINEDELMGLLQDLVPVETIQTDQGTLNVYKINLGIARLASQMREHLALTQPLRSQRDYGTTEEEEEQKIAAVEKGAVVRVEAHDNEWVLRFKETYRLHNADLTRFQHHLAELAQKADTVADAVTRSEMKVDYDWDRGDQNLATKITAGHGVVQLENVMRLQWNGSVDTGRMREELRSAAEFQGFTVFD